MAQIVPAILETTKDGFLDKVSRIVKFSGLERIQVDFGDGVFIGSKLISPEDTDSLNPAFEWEAHLMVKEPKDFLDYQICGFKVIIIHYEAFTNPNDLQQTLVNLKKMGFKNGVAINPDTSVEVLKDIVADQYLVMSVVPGKQGQSFIEATLERVKQLRKLLPNAIIEVDGGINMDNAKKSAEAGANLIVAGSVIVNSANPAESFEKLKQIVNN